MNEDQLFAALTKLVNKDMIRQLQRTVVFKNDAGDYELYGQYVISEHKNGFCIKRTNDKVEGVFGSIKNAITWVNYDHRNKVYESKRVKDLDSALSGLEVSIQLHERMYKKSKTADAKMLFLTKLQEDKLKKKQITRELDSLIQYSNVQQMKRFKKEAEKR